MIVFGVIPSNDTTDDSEILYNFAVYYNFMQLQPFTPVLGFVREGDFSYFLYHETCTDCNIIFSVTSHSSGGPDIFISKGGLKLPS